MSLSLPNEFERAVLDRVSSGQYASPEDVLSAMMEALDDDEAEYVSKLEALRRKIDVGLESEKRDPLIPSGEAEAWLRARVDEDEASEWLRARVGRKKIDAGEYRSASEAVGAGLRLLMEEDDALRNELHHGREQLERGETIPADVAFARLRESRGTA
jgi:Arc/MetJ-type ribon-helix-helix transcriptional regulator